MKDIWDFSQLEASAFVFVHLFVPMGFMFLLVECTR